MPAKRLQLARSTIAGFIGEALFTPELWHPGSSLDEVILAKGLCLNAAQDLGEPPEHVFMATVERTAGILRRHAGAAHSIARALMREHRVRGGETDAGAYHVNVNQESLMKLALFAVMFFFVMSSDAYAFSQCQAEPYARSIAGEFETSIRFLNRSSVKVRIYWLDYNGSRVFYSTLAPRHGYTQHTYLTHPWVVTDTGDNCKAVYYPDGQLRVVRIK